MRSRRISPCCAVTLATATQKSDEISRISAAPASARLFLAKINKNHACYVQTWSRPRLCSSAWSLCKFACTRHFSECTLCMLLLGPSWLPLHGEASLYLSLHRHLHLYLYLVPCARMTRTNREVEQVYFYLVYLYLCLSLSLSLSLPLPRLRERAGRTLPTARESAPACPCRIFSSHRGFPLPGSAVLFISIHLSCLARSLSLGHGPLADGPPVRNRLSRRAGTLLPSLSLSLACLLA